MRKPPTADHQNPVIAELVSVRELVVHRMHRSKATRVPKDSIVEIYIRLMTTKGKADFALVMEELPTTSSKAKRLGLYKALRRAVFSIVKWINEHNTEVPHNPIKVSFDSNGTVMVSSDFLIEKSVSNRVSSLRARMKLHVAEGQTILDELTALERQIG